MSAPTDTPPSPDTHLLLRAFVDELARCGMRAACTSPGSRSTPLVLALAREPRLRCYSHIDERCAGFFALGLAKATGLPVAVACTSGTATAELLPAAIEAREARVPLLLLTADRPAELRESGAGQAIDQLKLYGGAAKWFFEVGSHEATPERLRWMRTLACRAFWRTLEGRPGVVHLNFPLREPLVIDVPLPAEDTGRPDGRPLLTRTPSRLHAPGDLASLAKPVAHSRRGVVVAGRHERDTPLGEAAAAFCAAAGWPLLADPLSGARRGEAAVAHYDALLRDRAFAAQMTPDIVLRVGDLPVSKPLRAWLASMREIVPQAVLDDEDSWQDPDVALCRCYALDPAATLWQLSESPSAAEEDWLASWRSADERAAEALLGVLAAGRAGPGVLAAGRAEPGVLGGAGAPGAPGACLSEPAVAAELGVLLPAQATLFVASSMPVRDIESFWPVRPDPPRVLCNRGANGIDGTVSSAFGAAAAGEGPVVLLIGDVALAYDIGGLLAHSRLGLDLTIVLLNNEGGGIFDFLPVGRSQAAHRDGVYTEHIATPTGLDFSQAARLYGLGHELVEDVFAFRAALERSIEDGSGRGASIVEVRTERAANVELHRAAWEAVAAALDNTR